MRAARPDERDGVDRRTFLGYGARVIGGSLILGAGLRPFSYAGDQAYEAVELDASECGTIAGAVFLNGEAPPREVVQIEEKLQQDCGQEYVKDLLLVDAEGGVQNVLVQLADIRRGRGFDEEEMVAEIHKKGCRTVPHVFKVARGGELFFTNLDPILDTVKATPTRNPSFHTTFHYKGTFRQRVPNPERFLVTCAIHSWESGWAVVMAHPYYTLTDARGNFSMPLVPPGEYMLKFWHEKLGELEEPVVVEKGETTALELGFEPPEIDDEDESLLGR